MAVTVNYGTSTHPKGEFPHHGAQVGDYGFAGDRSLAFRH
jgi:hypothetical protein